MNILEKLSAIYKHSEGSGLSDEYFSNDSKVYQELKELSSLFELTPLQVTLLSIIASKYPHGAYFDGIANHLGCKALKIMSLRRDFTVLSDRGFIDFNDINSFFRSQNFCASDKLIDCLSKNTPYKIDLNQDYAHVHLTQFINANFTAFEGGIIDSNELEANTVQLLTDYKHSFLSKKLESIANGDWAIKCVLLYVYKYYNMAGLNYDKITMAINSNNTHKQSARLDKALDLLLSKKLIKITPENNIILSGRGNKALTLPPKKEKQKTADEIAKQANNDAIKELKSDGHILITPDSIIRKDLFYNKDVEDQLNELAELLSHDQFSTVLDSMKNNGMRTGFNCLLYGTPGTGKTEFVYQLAKRTERPIMKVDFSTMRNQFIGDSEKAMRKAFKDYKELVRASDFEPILLLNECDGLLGRRVNVRQVADQVNNACQAILLEELESINGISFATSNVPQVMDKAFERRFLYKIDFKNPDSFTRKKIWLSLNHGLTDSQATELSTNYELSGGQIENISRKLNVYTILHGDTQPTMELIHKNCIEELNTYSRNNSKIGFMV